MCPGVMLASRHVVQGMFSFVAVAAGLVVVLRDLEDLFRELAFGLNIVNGILQADFAFVLELHGERKLQVVTDS